MVKSMHLYKLNGNKPPNEEVKQLTNLFLEMCESFLCVGKYFKNVENELKLP